METFLFVQKFWAYIYWEHIIIIIIIYNIFVFLSCKQDRNNFEIRHTRIHIYLSQLYMQIYLKLLICVLYTHTHTQRLLYYSHWIIYCKSTKFKMIFNRFIYTCFFVCLWFCSLWILNFIFHSLYPFMNIHFSFPWWISMTPLSSTP